MEDAVLQVGLSEGSVDLINLGNFDVLGDHSMFVELVLPLLSELSFSVLLRTCRLVWNCRLSLWRAASVVQRIIGI